MKLIIEKSFEKDISKINDKKIRNSVADCLDSIKQLTTLTDIPNCRKLKKSKTANRIRIGDYRLGFYFENQTIEVVRFLHRSDIYKYFPE